MFRETSIIPRNSGSKFHRCGVRPAHDTATTGVRAVKRAKQKNRKAQSLDMYVQTCIRHRMCCHGLVQCTDAWALSPDDVRPEPGMAVACSSPGAMSTGRPTGLELRCAAV